MIALASTSTFPLRRAGEHEVLAIGWWVWDCLPGVGGEDWTGFVSAWHHPVHHPVPQQLPGLGGHRAGCSASSTQRTRSTKERTCADAPRRTETHRDAPMHRGVAEHAGRARAQRVQPHACAVAAGRPRYGGRNVPQWLLRCIACWPSLVGLEPPTRCSIVQLVPFQASR